MEMYLGIRVDIFLKIYQYLRPFKKIILKEQTMGKEQY